MKLIRVNVMLITFSVVKAYIFYILYSMSKILTIIVIGVQCVAINLIIVTT